MVDFPEPDSPAKTNTSPSFIEKEIPSVAFTSFVFELNVDFSRVCIDGS